MDPHRTERISESMREELAELIGYELEDPRLASVEVTQVILTPDLRQARVLVSLARVDSAPASLSALNGARHLLRHKLAERLGLFRTPDLRFEPDSIVAGGRIPSLLRRVRKGRSRDGKVEDAR
jgi:ribosome-binding factor A